jgi:hypothetical protein
MTSVLMSAVASTNCSIDACMGVPKRERSEVTLLMAHQK